MLKGSEVTTKTGIRLSLQNMAVALTLFSLAAGITLGGFVFPAKKTTSQKAPPRQTSTPITSRGPLNPYVPGRVLVKFSVPENERQAIIDRVVQEPQQVVREKSSQRVMQRDEPLILLHPERYTTTEVRIQVTSRERVFADAAIPHQAKEILTRRNKQDADLQQALETLGTDKWEAIIVNTDADVVELASRFQNANGVVAAQPDHVVSLMLETIPQDPPPGGGSPRPNDPYYSSSGTWGNAYRDLWGLQRINTQSAWGMTRGDTGTIVAVPDTGVDYTHPDLQGQLWQNAGEISNNQIDDDANGFIDDVRGWDFAYGTNDPMDDFGHGTHIAGTIGATTNNALGIAGINWRVQLMAIKVFSSSGHSSSQWVANALRYAADNGADVINMSWGLECVPGDEGSRDCDPLLYDAIGYVHEYGVVAVAAAGNANDNTRFYYPAFDHRIVTVGAWSWEEARATFSNWGEELDVTAPGVEVLSLRAVNTDMYLGSGGYVPGDRIVPPCSDHSGNPGACPNNKYYRANGTSMAAPHAAGAAALVLSRHPEFTNEAVRQVLRASADDSSPVGVDLYTGAGVIRADRALRINKPLSSKILSPAHEAIVSQEAGTLTITGTAAGMAFQSFTLEYGAGVLPASYTTIATGSAPVQEGTLGQWAIGELPDGPYTLQLVATSTEGFNFRDLVFIDLERVIPTQVSTTNPPFQAYTPLVSGNRIVWHMFYWDGQRRHSEIYLYDLGPDGSYGTGDCYPGGSCEGERLLDAPQDSALRSFAGDIIVWQSSSQNAITMCRYNETTGSCPTYPLNAIPPSMQGEVTIDGTRIVWTDSIYGDSYVNVYELGPDSIPGTGDCYPGGACEGNRRITPLLPHPFHPSISGNYIVWSDAAYPQAYELYLYDLLTGTTRSLTNVGTDQVWVTIEGNRLVWLSFNADWSQSNIQTCIYNAAEETCSAETASTNGGHFSTVHFSGQSIVWDHDPLYPLGFMDIFLYRLNTQTSQTFVGPIHSRQIQPKVSGTHVVWSDDRTGRREVMLRELPQSGGGGSPLFLKINVSE